MGDGNVKAMREALEKINKLNHYDLGCIRSKKRRDEFDSKILEIERAVSYALSSPPRNCDVGTAEDQEVRFKHFCASNYSLCDVDMECCRCPLESEKACCQFAWSQMPYESELEGDNNGGKYVAAMRETLEYAREVLSLNGFVEPVIRCDAALALPRRNCDVGTAEEQAERFTKVCMANSKDGVRGLCSETCPFGMDYQNECALAWAQMPYEEGDTE